METPVVFIIFQRPDTTEKVFQAIRQAKPKKLFVIADAPRKDKLGEDKKCEATRAIIEKVDWNCEVFKNYSDINLGCGKRVSSGLNWVFEQVEEAIILEDDCLPNPTFFHFCEELLEKYRYDERVASISGQNVQLGRKIRDYSYYFSRYNHIWGWATWRRAWQHFDMEMKHWEIVRDSGFMNNIFADNQSAKIWYQVFQETHNKRKNIWGYQWQFACWLHNRVGIISNVNLISNIGFGEGAANTTNSKSKHANLATEVIELPMKHPPYMICDVQADDFTQNTLFAHIHPNLLQRAMLKMQAQIG